MNLLNATRDHNLFAPWFRDPTSWAAWFAFIAALFALPMTPTQCAIYQQCTRRIEAPTTPHTEAWLVCGRRAGKSFILALIAVYLATFHDYKKYLSPGERATVMVIAADRKQARIIFRYIRALLTEVPLLARMIEHENAEAFHLNNSTNIEIQTASTRAIRGYTVVAALLDELAFWQTSTESAHPDNEVLAALRPSMATIPHAMLLCASSPFAKRGVLYETYKNFFGVHSGTLVWQAATRAMNPTVPADVIAAAEARDPASAAVEYGAQFRGDDLNLTFNEKLINAAFSSDVRPLWIS